MRFIATADWQLGMTAHFLGDEARARFSRDRIAAVQRVARLADERGAEFVVVCGDVFESNQLDRAIISRAFEALRLFTVPVILLPGNHDPLDSASLYTSATFQQRCPAHVRVITDAEPISPVPGVEVVGAPWRSKRPDEDLLARAYARLEPAPEGIVRVLAGHGSASTINPDRTALSEIDIPGVQHAIDRGAVQFVVLGDRHSTTEIAERIWYPGAVEVTARREEDPGNVLLIDIDPQTRKATVEAVHVGRWAFVTLEQRFSGADDLLLLQRRLEELPDKDRTAVWLTGSGQLTIAERVELDRLLDEARDVFARIDFWDRNTELTVIPDGLDAASLGLQGFAVEAAEELMETSRGGDDDAAIAQDALALLYRLSGGVR